MDVTKCFHHWDSLSGLYCSHISSCLFIGTSLLSVLSWVTKRMLCLVELRRKQYFCCHWETNNLSLLASTSLWKSYWEFQWSAAKCNFKTWNWKLWCCTEAKVYKKKCVTVFQIQTFKICQVKEGNDGDIF